jgi:hypothetical protein
MPARRERDQGLIDFMGRSPGGREDFFGAAGPTATPLVGYRKSFASL